MLTFSVLSDVHLEFNPLTLENTEKTDVLLLLGDITVFRHIDLMYERYSERLSDRTMEFFQSLSQQWGQVIYLLGNHEYYHGQYDKIQQQTSVFLTNFKNIDLLDYYATSSIEIGDVTFVGGTLWTDAWKTDVFRSQFINEGMNDFHIITKESGAKFHIKDSYDEFVLTMENIRKTIKEAKEGQKVVVATHHAPCGLSVAPEFKGNSLNGGFYSELSEFILDEPRIKYWCHGHMHNFSDYLLGETRILCNPRGYRGVDVDLKSYKI